MAFFWARSLVIFGAITVVSLYVRVAFGAARRRHRSGVWRRMGRGICAHECAPDSATSAANCTRTHSIQGKLAVVLVLLFGMGWVVLAWDHSMSLDYRFFSTMYGWQVFMGGWVAMLMAWAILARWWRDYLGLGDVITEVHLHDIGKLCFAFTVFWGYVTFAQYLVIWYGNVGEETHFFRLRLIDSLEDDHRRGRHAGVRPAVLRPAVREGQDVRARDDVLRAVLARRHLARPVHRGVSVGVRQTALNRSRSDSGRSA